MPSQIPSPITTTRFCEDNSSNPSTSKNVMKHRHKARPPETQKAVSIQHHSIIDADKVCTSNLMPAEDQPMQDSSSLQFDTDNLAYLPIATVSPQDGRPWATFLSHHLGQNVEVQSSKNGALDIKALALDGDPGVVNLLASTGKDASLVAAQAINNLSGRCDKMCGRLENVTLDTHSNTMNLRVTMTEALDNAPKYLLMRSFAPAQRTSPPAVVYSNINCTDAIPTPLTTFIHARDTIFYATPLLRLAQSPETPRLGVNHRGGLPGFCRVATTKQGRTVVHIPDHSRRGLLTSLGTLAESPLMGAAFADFKTGDVLYLTGDAEDLYGGAAEAVMPRVRSLTRLTVSGYVFIRGALPIREVDGKQIGPKLVFASVRYLTDEPALTGARILDGVVASLVGVRMHPAEGQKSHEADVATLTFVLSERVEWKAGQFVVVDCRGLQGSRKAGKDDGIRTWTITSLPSPPDVPPKLSITVRAIPNGRITPKIVAVARALSVDPSAFQGMDLSLPLRIIGGAFILPPYDPSAVDQSARPPSMLFVAGGIGITRFLVILRSLRAEVRGKADTRRDVEMWIACKATEEGMLLRLVEDATGASTPDTFSLRVRTFVSPVTWSTAPRFDSFDCARHQGRLTASAVREAIPDVGDMLRGRSVYLCGPANLEDAALKALGELGVADHDVKRECFGF